MAEILYMDKNILVCHKPAGLVCEGEGSNSLPVILRRQLADAGLKSEIFPVHRLDRETEGIVVFALSSYAAAKLSAQISSGEWRKVYRARICGTPEEEYGSFSDLLYYDRMRSKSYVVDRERKGVKRALLEYKTIAHSTDGKYTLVEVRLHTGRTHQIRVQFASRGLPICGDRRYGAPAESGNSLALAAVSLDMRHPITDEELHFVITVPFPEEI